MHSRQERGTHRSSGKTTDCSPDGPAAFDLFVYGSLKPGESGYEHFCREAQSFTPARVRGALFESPAGYPVLFVAESDVLAEGTDAPADDAERARDCGDRAVEPAADVAPAHGLSLRWIDGFVLRFVDADRAISAIDDYEDFVPGTPCLYRRVLVPTAGESTGTAWTYVAPQGAPDKDLRPIPSGVWRPRDAE